MRRGVFCALLLTLLGACASKTPLESAPSSGPTGSPAGTDIVAPGQWLGGLALPPGSAIRADQSLIIGAGETWVGRAVLEVGRDGDAAYNHFMNQLPAQGWTIVTAVRGRQSLIVLTRQERTLTIEIGQSMLSGAAAYLTMAPRNAVVMTPKKP